LDILEKKRMMQEQIMTRFRKSFHEIRGERAPYSSHRGKTAMRKLPSVSMTMKLGLDHFSVPAARVMGKKKRIVPAHSITSPTISKDRRNRLTPPGV
jgi:hypothetical protein